MRGTPINADKFYRKNISHRDHGEHKVSAGGEIFRLKIVLMDCKPSVWREVEIASSTTLARLHDVLQVLMDWEDCHLWAFEAGEKRFEPPDPETNTKLTAGDDPNRMTLGALLRGRGASLRYNYDFGDDWWVDIQLAAVGDPQPNVRYPRCLAGERAGPPEDCGGPHRFEELLKARKNPKRRGAEELLEWVGPDWDPEAFDLAVVNKALSALPAPRRLH